MVLHGATRSSRFVENFSLNAYTHTIMSILVAGTIAIDNIKTPVAEAKNLLGGSASYAALSASYFCDDVRLVGIVGKDYPQEHLDMLAAHGIGSDGVEKSDADSFTWTGEYFDNMNDRQTHAVALNVLENWQPKVPEGISDAKVCVLANMSPDNQMTTLDQCWAADFVVADSMDLWIEIARDRLKDVLKRLDLFVINDGEARELTGESNLVIAGEALLAMGPKAVVIKLGEYGAMLFGSDGQFFRAGAYPLREVNDPTGAGDTFLGGLAGALVKAGAVGGDGVAFEDLKQAVVMGTIMASFTCEEFSTRKIQNLSSSTIEERYNEFKANGLF